MLWDDYINSYWRDWRTGDRSQDKDRLEDQQWLGEWLVQHNLPAAAVPEPAELAKLQELRGLLRAEVQKLVQGVPPDQTLLDQLNGYMAEGPCIRQIVRKPDKPPELSLLPQRSDWGQIMAEIAASFGEAVLDKDTSRFRICDNPDCLWVYYDDTRNRSKRYCDDKMCGNLMKVRRFRARKKAGDGEQNTD